VAGRVGCPLGWTLQAHPVAAHRSVRNRVVDLAGGQALLGQVDGRTVSVTPGPLKEETVE
jgi:hypothetical protein